MSLSSSEIEGRIRELGPWFHNIDLQGQLTAPDHFLGNYPRQKFRKFADAIPADLTGKTVLDIGCNGGFYSLEMKRRGAERVLGVDFDEAYLAQARFVAEVEGADIEFRQLSVYDVGKLGETFDVVLFMGVLYHLRHPLLALDLIREHAANDLLVFQSMQRGSKDVAEVAENYPFEDTKLFDDPAFPHMAFIEHRYADDPTNWWVPNRAGMEAMLAGKPGEYINMLVIFDNEEVGSGTKQGADSTFLKDVLARIRYGLSLEEEKYQCMLADSFLISADNAHGVHPNHPEKADPENRPYLNEGIVIKYHGSQRYATDAYSGAVMKELCRKAGVPYQTYANRSDIPGGSTLGNILMAQVSMNTVDIGLPQLAMHSAYETAGSRDIAYLIEALTVFYQGEAL